MLFFLLIYALYILFNFFSYKFVENLLAYFFGDFIMKSKKTLESYFFDGRIMKIITLSVPRSYVHFLYWFVPINYPHFKRRNT